MTHPAAITLRAFHQGDAESISELFRIVYGERYVYPDVYLPEMIRYHNKQRRWHTVVAAVKNRIIGQAILWQEALTSDSAELAMVIVHPEFRGNGIATRLGKYLCSYACLKHITTLTIKMVSSHTQTQQLAHTLGFHTTGLLLDYVDSPFKATNRESIILGVLPLQPRPLPHYLNHYSHKDWINLLIDKFGTAIQWPKDEKAFPLRLREQDKRIDVILDGLRNIGLIKQVAQLPCNRLIHLRIRLMPALLSFLPQLHQAGYADMGMAPAPNGEWYWLLQRGYAPAELNMSCPVARALYANISKTGSLEYS